MSPQSWLSSYAYAESMECDVMCRTRQGNEESRWPSTNPVERRLECGSPVTWVQVELWQGTAATTHRRTDPTREVTANYSRSSVSSRYTSTYIKVEIASIKGEAHLYMKLEDFLDLQIFKQN